MTSHLQIALKYVDAQIKLVKKQEADGLKERDTTRFITKKFRLGLEKIKDIVATASGLEKLTLQNLKIIQEILLGFENNFRRPIPKSVNLFGVPHYLSKRLNHVVGHGTKPAINIVNSGGDLSLVDPENSLFWSPVQDIHAQNLYFGFSRKEIPSFSNVICT